MDENEFEFNGLTYVAKCGDDCSGCSMDADDTCYAAPRCASSERKDGREVIFVEKHP